MAALYRLHLVCQQSPLLMFFFPHSVETWMVWSVGMQWDYHLTFTERTWTDQPVEWNSLFFFFFWSLRQYNAFWFIMSTLKHVYLQDKHGDVEKKQDWDYIEWAENEVLNTRMVDAQTQTDSRSVEHKESQTSNLVVMRIDLTRTHSKLRHLSLLDDDNLVAPAFQFNRQAPGRISTSPTLRRMRSTRCSLVEPPGSLRISKQEDFSSACSPSTKSTVYPVRRVKSPLAANALSDGELYSDRQPHSSCGRQRTRSKTIENGVTSPKKECQSAHPVLTKEFQFADESVEVSFFGLRCHSYCLLS